MHTSNIINHAIEMLKCYDPVMSEIIDAVGKCKLVKKENLYLSLIGSVLSQQLSGRVAEVIFSNLSNGLSHHITPESVLNLTHLQFRGFGISSAKESYIRGISEKFFLNSHFLSDLDTLNDNEVLSQLTAIRGVGLWTAQMFMIFSLNRLDIFPLHDVSIRRGISKLYFNGKTASDKEIIGISEKWKPYRSIAVWYIWRKMDGKPKGPIQA